MFDSFRWAGGAMLAADAGSCGSAREAALRGVGPLCSGDALGAVGLVQPVLGDGGTVSGLGGGLSAGMGPSQRSEQDRRLGHGDAVDFGGQPALCARDGAAGGHGQSAGVGDEASVERRLGAAGLPRGSGRAIGRVERKHLWRSVEPVLGEPWIWDLDVTSKTVYGRQQGAEVGYNPRKPGRLAHAYHTFFISRLRLVLDVVVAPGKQFHSRAVSRGFWQWWEQLPASHRPRLVRGDCAFGNEYFLSECESPEHLQAYLFRLRQSPG